MCGSAVKSAETSVVGRLFHSALVRRQMLLAECWKPTEVSKQLLFIVMLWHLHLSLLFEGWSLLLTFYLDQIDVSLLTFCSVANILILCSAQFWLGCGGVGWNIVPSHTVERNRAVDPAKAKGRTNFSRKVLRQVPALGPLSKRCSPTCQTAAPASCRTVNGCVFSTTEGFANIRRKHVVIWGFTNVTTRVAQRSDLTLSVSTDLVSRNKTIQFLTLMQTNQ